MIVEPGKTNLIQVIIKYYQKTGLTRHNFTLRINTDKSGKNGFFYFPTRTKPLQYLGNAENGSRIIANFAFRSARQKGYPCKIFR